MLHIAIHIYVNKGMSTLTMRSDIDAEILKETTPTKFGGIYKSLSVQIPVSPITVMSSWIEVTLSNFVVQY